jgi:hypothetical protein
MLQLKPALHTCTQSFSQQLVLRENNPVNVEDAEMAYHIRKACFEDTAYHAEGRCMPSRLQLLCNIIEVARHWAELPRAYIYIVLESDGLD